jgi:hypothetical protein
MTRKSSIVNKSASINMSLKSKVSAIGQSSPERDEEQILSSNDSLKECLPYIQSDLQYAFLAIQGHELIINFMKKNKDLR